MSSMKNVKRIMLKLSGETLKGNGEGSFDTDFINKLAKKIVALSKKKIEIVIVLWAGNIIRGTQFDAVNRITGDYLGMVGTVINATVVAEAIQNNWGKAKVFTSLDMPKVAASFFRREALDRIKAGEIVFCAGWTGSPFCTTDSAAVQKALELNCDVVVKATKVDGIYDKDPMKHKNAKRFDHINLTEVYKLGLNIMDHSAIAMAMDNKLPMFVCKIDDLEKLGSNKIVGTYVGV